MKSFGLCPDRIHSHIPYCFGIALHQQMEKTKDAATTHCAEVETKVEKALETFVALEKAEKALRQAEEADAKAKANAESAKKALDDFKNQEDAWRTQEAELQGAEAAYDQEF